MTVPGPLPLTTDTASSKPSAPQLMTRAKTPSKQTLGAKKACQAGRRGHATHTAIGQSARPAEPRPGLLTHTQDSKFSYGLVSELLKAQDLDKCSS